MGDRKVFLLMVWLVAMSSLDLSMGKMFSSFRLSKGDEVRNVDKKVIHRPKVVLQKDEEATQDEFTVNPNAQGASINVAQNGGLGVNTAPSTYNKFTVNPSAQAAFSNVDQNGGFGVNTAPLRSKRFTNPARQAASNNIAENGGYEVNTAKSTNNKFTKNYATQAQGASSNVAHNDVYGVHRVPSTSSKYINAARHAARGFGGQNMDGFDEGGSAEFKNGCEKTGSDCVDASHFDPDAQNSNKFNVAKTPGSKQGGAKGRTPKSKKGDNMENIALKHGGAEDNEGEGDDIEIRRPKQGGAKLDRGANYMVEKREQSRKLAGIMVERRDQEERKQAEIPDSHEKESGIHEAYAAYVSALAKAEGAMNTASYVAGKVMDNAPDIAKAAKSKVEELADYAMGMGTNMAASNAKSEGRNMAASDAKSEDQNMAATDTESKGQNMVAGNAKSKGSNMAANNVKSKGSNMGVSNAKSKGPNVASSNAKSKGPNMASSNVKSKGQNMAPTNAKSKGPNMAANNAESKDPNMASNNVKSKNSNMGDSNVESKGSNMASSNTESKGSNMAASNAESKGPNMATSNAKSKGTTMTKRLNYGANGMPCGTFMHAASQYAKNKAFRGMNTPHMGSVKYKRPTASEHAKHKADREMNTATDNGLNAMNMMKDKPSNANEYASDSDNVDEKIIMATEKVKEAKERWDDAKMHGKKTAFQSYVDAKVKAHEAYQLARNTMMEIIAMEKYEEAKEKALNSPRDLGSYMSDGVMGDGVWEL